MSAGLTTPVRTPVLLAYVLPALVIALPTIPVYINLPTLYGVELGLGLASTGLILLVARLFDTVTDPLIGALSDRYGFRGASRKPWIAIGAMIAGLGLYQVLTPPDVITENYLLIWLIVLYGGWTMVSVPYLAWGAELHSDYHQRTRITAWRESLALIGMVGAGALSAVTAQMGWTDIRSIGAIAWLAIILGALVFPLLLGVVPDKKHKLGAKAPSKHIEFGWLVKSIFRNRIFLRLLSAWFLNGLANGIPAALFLIYLEHGLGAGPQERPLFILAYFVAGIAAIPLWSRMSKSYGKNRVWCMAMALACAAFLMVPFLPTGSFFMFAVVCVFTGMALGADLALPPAIQADVIDYHHMKFGHESAGLQFALWGMCTKLALAVSVGIALPALAFFGFDPENIQARGITALLVIYAIVPIVIKLVAIAVVWRFPITALRHAAIKKRLDRRLSGASGR